MVKRTISLILFLFLTYCILTHSAFSLSLASTGLRLWYDRMIPALLPFMILSGTLIRMGLSDGFTALVYPVVKMIYGVNRNVCYVMVMGFLCGFPMGAKCVSDLYQRGRLTADEASFLLAFCNNIGPVYFVSFALPVIGCNQVLLPVVGMYGLPALYGLVLRYTAFRRIGKPQSVTGARLQTSDPKASEEMPLLPALDESIFSSLQSMLMLGGYMILFNLLMLIPAVYMPSTLPYLAPFLEITGGLSLLGKRFPGYSMILLPFGGMSCLAQTYTCIRHTDLSLSEYVKHKGILTGLTCIYYLLLRFLRLL